MDKKEILDGLYEIKNWKCGGDAKMHAVIEAAIKALEAQFEVPSAEPEPCEDAVNRRKLLNDLGELITAWKKHPVMAEQIKGVETAIEYVETIPSAQPERRGRWIVWYECPNCGEERGYAFDTCPMCGAKMKEGEQTE